MLQQHEIIMMARQVGYTPFEALKWERALTNFAKLVASAAIAKEREACAKLVEVSDDLEDWEIICGSDGRELLNAMAAAIRARGRNES